MKPRRKKLLLALLCATIITASLGIYYYNAVHRLSFRLVGGDLGQIGMTSAELKLIFEVQNPNMLPVYIPSGSFEVYVNDQHLASGYFNAFTVGGNSRQRVTVPFTITILDVVTAIYGLVTGGGTVTVKAEGTVGFIIFSIPFSTTMYDAKFTS